jgi:hypothetical protein
MSGFETSFMNSIQEDSTRMTSLGFSEDRIAAYKQTLWRGGATHEEAFAVASDGLALNDTDRAFASSLLENFPSPDEV